MTTLGAHDLVETRITLGQAQVDSFHLSHGVRSPGKSPGASIAQSRVCIMWVEVCPGTWCKCPGAHRKYEDMARSAVGPDTRNNTLRPDDLQIKIHSCPAKST